MIITSKDNQKIKDVIALRGSRGKREEANQIFLEGLRLCIDAFRSGASVDMMFVTEKALERVENECPELWEQAWEKFLVSESIADKLSDTKTNQGVFCICEMPKPRELKLENGIVILSSLQDPGNVGTIIRTCEAFGIGGIILSEDCPDIYSPKVLRGTMGGVFRLPILITKNILETIADLKGKNIPVYGAALDEQSKSIGELSLKGCAVVVGNEGKGLSEEIKNSCDGLVIIPITPESESLNAAVAASILAWEMAR